MTSSTLDPTQAAFLLRRWQQILQDPNLADIPERIETDAHGNIIMSPRPESEHDRAAFLIRQVLEYLLPGKGSFGELEVLTDQGIKIPDVLWLNPDRDHGHLPKPIAPAPDICVEVLSPTNKLEELDQKREAYLRAGAREVWICREDNHIEFFNPHGQISQSEICPRCPATIHEIEKVIDRLIGQSLKNTDDA